MSSLHLLLRLTFLFPLICLLPLLVAIPVFRFCCSCMQDVCSQTFPRVNSLATYLSSHTIWALHLPWTLRPTGSICISVLLILWALSQKRGRRQMQGERISKAERELLLVTFLEYSSSLMKFSGLWIKLGDCVKVCWRFTWTLFYICICICICDWEGNSTWECKGEIVILLLMGMACIPLNERIVPLCPSCCTRVSLTRVDRVDVEFSKYTIIAVCFLPLKVLQVLKNAAFVD